MIDGAIRAWLLITAVLGFIAAGHERVVAWDDAFRPQRTGRYFLSSFID